jgi:hypothetical protein
MGNLVMVDILDFIHLYEECLDPNICQFLINLFEENADKHERYDNEGKPNFTQFNLTENYTMNDDVNSVHTYLIEKTIEYRDIYYQFIDGRVFPQEHAFEQFRIKKYNSDGIDQFDTHVDVLDHQSAKRYLSFTWYLNDVNEGGATIFKDLKIVPKTGSLLMFPPLWMFPHKGEPPISNPKYILTTYLHYK